MPYGTVNQTADQTVNEIIGWVILVGIILTYLPQYRKIVKNRTSKGFSPHYLFLGHLGALCAWNNALIFYFPDWQSCSGWNDCISHILGWGQLWVQWLCFLTLSIIYLIFWNDSETISKKLLKGLVALSALISIIFITVNIILISRDHWQAATYKSTTIYGDILSTVTTICTCLQYFPQIYYTYKADCIGSLSLVTLAIQAPGTLAWTVYLALQSASDYSTWIPYLLTGLFQLTLLAMGLYYQSRAKRQEKRPLLDSYSGSSSGSLPKVRFLT